MPFFATMPTTMLSPMNDETLNSVRVIKSAKKTPDVDRTADARIAIGAVYERNSKSSTRKIKTTASHNRLRHNTKVVGSKNGASRGLAIRVDHNRRRGGRLLNSAFDGGNGVLAANVHLQPRVGGLRRPILVKVRLV